MNIPPDLIQSITMQMLIRGNRLWDGDAAREVVALSHLSLKTKTSEEVFRRLVKAVFQVGRAMDFGYEKLTYKTPNWDTFFEEISKIMISDLSNDEIDFFIKRLQGKVGSYSLEAKRGRDWVEIINDILNQHDIHIESFCLEKKLRICEVIEKFMGIRMELKASCAATDMGISIEKISNSIIHAFNNLDCLSPSKKLRTKSDSQKIVDEECFQEMLLLSDAEAVDEIEANLKSYSSVIPKIIMRRWLAFKEDPISEKLWSKSIRGTSGLIREMIIVHKGTHYRLLYKKDTNSQHPFLAFGLRRDLFPMVEKARCSIMKH